MIGLNISSAFKSLVAIYILIPLMLVPQILLSGAIVPFDKLNFSMKSEKYVPIIGDIMISRWAFEALAVEQFRSNDYQKYWFNINQRKSNVSYLKFNLIPVLGYLIEDIKKDLIVGQIKINDVKALNSGLKIINNEIRNPLNYSISKESISIAKLEDINAFLNNCKITLANQLGEIKNIENNIYDNLYLKFNNDDKELLEFKQKNYNNSIADYVLRNNEFKKLIIEDEQIIRKAEPIYYIAENKFGRAHFYAPEKRIGQFLIDTFFFNTIILWIISLFLYVFLITDSLKIFINFLGG
jgi:hypothetical protein